ncbi:MAG: peptide ABC transporter substrate-binding protein [Treponema sp.]|nr:peptide ABC transporter substrate-binding protein [Treponema sp.]
MKKFGFLLVLIMIIFISCGGGTATDTAGQAVPRTGMVEFREVYSSEFTTLDYNNASTANVAYHGSMTVATLVDYDKYGVIQGRLATDWRVSPDGTVYTFDLRDDVYWYTLAGAQYAKMTAHDFVQTAQWMLTAENASIINNNLTAVILNAQAYLDKEITDFSRVGVRALNDYTVQYTLTGPVPWFMSMLTYGSYFPSHVPFRNEMGVRYGTSNDAMLYSGPYIMSTFDPQVRQVYTRNPNYWDPTENQIDRIERIFNREAQTIAPELFLRGEIYEADIRPDQIAEWIGNDEREWMLYNTPPGQFAMFYAINFDPRYGEEYNPSNWQVAVNNINFRKALYHAIDYVSLAMTIDPYNPEQVLLGTINRRGFITTPGGIDYVDQAPLAAYTDVIPYDPALARQYMETAMRELQGRVTFPVTLVLPYNTGSVGMTQRVQLLQQQYERNLGNNFVDVVLVPHPNTGFSIEVRNTGIFSLLETSWGPDAADPVSALDPFNGGNPVGWRYGRVFMAEETFDSRGLPIYQQMIDTAHAEVLDLARRYRMIAEAEQYLLDMVLVIPFYRTGFEYYVSYLDPFSGNNTMHGLVRNKHLGKVMLTRPYNPDELAAAYARYNAEREAAHRNAPRR